MRTYQINGITAHAEPIDDSDGNLEGYRVIVNGEVIGNRIERSVVEDGKALFHSIARNELVINTHDELREAVVDVLNDGMRDRTRR